MAKSPDRFVPPPIDGIDWRCSIMDAPMTSAYQIDNFICGENSLYTPAGLSVATLADVPGGVSTIWTSTEADKFYTDNTGIYNFAGVLQIALTQGVGNWLNVSTGASNFSFFFNGVDVPKFFNCTTNVWANIAWSGGVTLANLFKATLYRHRMYALDWSQLGFWYLPPDAVTGAAAFYDCGTVFSRGGYVMEIGTLTLDGGNGPDDMLAVYSSGGEVALFSGNDPAATDWTPVGVYYIGKPQLGYVPVIPFPHKQMVKLGGDLLIWTTFGITSVYEVMRGATGGTLKCVTDKIWPGLSTRIPATVRLDTLLSRNLLVASLGNLGVYVLNLKTGAWSRFPYDVTAAKALGNVGVWHDSTDGNIYAYSSADTKIRYAMQSPVGNIGTDVDYVIQTNYFRLDSLLGVRNLQMRPHFLSTDTPTFTVGASTGLEYNFQNQTVPAVSSAWKTVNRYALDQPLGPGAANLLSRSWQTVACDVDLNLALKFTSRLGGIVVADAPLIYLGADLGNEQSSMYGS